MLTIKRFGFFLLWLLVCWGLFRVGAIQGIYDWWQNTIIDPAFGGYTGMYARKWWGLPAIMFQLPVTFSPLFLTGALMAFLSHRFLEAKK